MNYWEKHVAFYIKLNSILVSTKRDALDAYVSLFGFELGM